MADEARDEVEPIVTRIIRCDPNDLRTLDDGVNARYMTHEQFARLVANVRRDGRLTSVPLAVLEPDGSYLVLSGNHRVRAASAAGLDEIDVMVTDQHLSHERRIALQLSHNSVTGQDDPARLKELWESIDDIDWREFAGLDDKTLKLLDEVKPGSLSEANLDFETLSFMFLPSELERVKAAFADAKAMSSGADERWCLHLDQFDDLLDALEVAGKSAGVTVQAIALQTILAVFLEHVTDLADRWPVRAGTWVPVQSVTGWDMPLDAATVVKQCIDRMTAREEITHPWQMLELLAADYLAQP